jgi:hypothetical protein
MNKNFKVIQVHGLSGLLILGFVLTGVFCGFVIFPIWVIMNAWNAIVGDVLRGPMINYFQASLLWTFIALSLYLILKNSISIKIQQEEILDNKDIKNLINEMKHHSKIEEVKEEEVKK